MDNAGNITDACLLAVVAVLLAFKRPDVTVDASTSSVTIHSPDVREPLPLSVHHTPLAVTFALFGVRALLFLIDLSLCAGLQS